MYQRQEHESIRAFYRLPADFAETIPQDLDRFLGHLAEQTGLPRSVREFPIEAAAIRRAAEAFAQGAQQVFEFPLRLDDADPGQIDRFAERCLVDPAARAPFAAPGPGEALQEKHAEQSPQATGRLRVPNDPLLFYAMGSFWGEWLVRHQQCRWALYAPLNPVQSFPDMLTAGGTVCLHPFSQGCKKLTDPEGDNLAFKARSLAAMKRYFPPFPLLASLADAGHATVQMLPEPARLALAARGRGDEAKALGLLLQASNEAPDNAQVLHMIVMSAWALQRFDVVEGASYHLLDILPDHPVVNHNLAALYASRPELLREAVSRLETALKADPQYGRARLTLASCLRDLGRHDEARQHAAWVRDHDAALKAEAEELLREILKLSS